MQRVDLDRAGSDHLASSADSPATMATAWVKSSDTDCRIRRSSRRSENIVVEMNQQFMARMMDGAIKVTSVGNKPI